MSITELRLVPQSGTQSDRKQSAIIARRSETLDFTNVCVISREQLTEAYESTRGVSRRLHNIEDLSELGWHDVAAMCRQIHHATEALAAMLEKGAVAR
ncbi:MAG: hypothetical protein H0U81_10440 [Pyrinomonadaceae bacterium]|nr:hypothetical protein [Pyrinomonadaceae bacterium]